MTVADLLARLDGVHQGARGWTARCPAHEDRDPSLSVAEGDDGCVLLTCFGGCRIEAITAALGLTLKDLFATPTSGLSSREISQRRPTSKPDFCAKPAPDPSNDPSALWATIRQQNRKDRREDLRLEEKIATSIFALHRRARSVRLAATALGRDDDRTLDLLADAAADERMALWAEATLDELRAEYQAIMFRPRRTC